jgi:hypothetical protein
LRILRGIDDSEDAATVQMTSCILDISPMSACGLVPGTRTKIEVSRGTPKRESVSQVREERGRAEIQDETQEQPGADWRAAKEDEEAHSDEPLVPKGSGRGAAEVQPAGFPVNFQSLGDFL